MELNDKSSIKQFTSLSHCPLNYNPFGPQQLPNQYARYLFLLPPLRTGIPQPLKQFHRTHRRPSPLQPKISRSPRPQQQQPNAVPQRHFTLRH